MSRPAAAQAARVAVEAIEEGVVRLVGGRAVAVLEVSPVNFALKGEGEQEAIVAAYAAYLNGLTFPVQEVVRVEPFDLRRQVEDLEDRARRERSEALAELARDQAAFLRRLARNRTLLERRFYVVVPADEATPTSRGWWPFRRRRSGVAEAGTTRRQLGFRCAEVERQLARCGLVARRLDDAELAQLELSCWCPELARVQRLRRALAEYTAPVVQAPAREGRSAWAS